MSRIVRHKSVSGGQLSISLRILKLVKNYINVGVISRLFTRLSTDWLPSSRNEQEHRPDHGLSNGNDLYTDGTKVCLAFGLGNFADGLYHKCYWKLKRAVRKKSKRLDGNCLPVVSYLWTSNFGETS